MRADLLALNACINAHDKGLAALHKYESDPAKLTKELKCVCIDLHGHFGDVEKSQKL